MTSETAPTRAQATLALLRGALLAILVIGLLGVLAELYLLEHTEEAWQRLPIFMIVAALVVLGWHAFDHGPLSVQALRITMGLFVLTGLVGVVLHFKGNIEFELDMQPSLEGLQLIWLSLRGATPTLAPGTMVQLGLIGLAYCYRHPRLRAGQDARAPLAG